MSNDMSHGAKAIMFVFGFGLAAIMLDLQLSTRAAEP